MDRDRARLTITVRSLAPGDVDRIVKLDSELTGRNRRAWFEGKIQRALGADSDVRISLGAEVDGTLVGGLLGAVHYGEFGQPEPVAILDTILVERSFHGKGVGQALLGQLVKNLRGLRIERIRTEVGWTEQALIGFLAKEGFVPAPRLVLELDVESAARRGEREVDEAE